MLHLCMSSLGVFEGCLYVTGWCLESWGFGVRQDWVWILRLNLSVRLTKIWSSEGTWEAFSTGEPGSLGLVHCKKQGEPFVLHTQSISQSSPEKQNQQEAYTHRERWEIYLRNGTVLLRRCKSKIYQVGKSWGWIQRSVDRSPSSYREVSLFLLRSSIDWMHHRVPFAVIKVYWSKTYPHRNV
jgi:hypothetical protein